MLIGTRKAQKRLVEEYGLDARQAEGIVEFISSANEKIATKTGLEALEARLRVKMYSTDFLTITIMGALNFFT